MNLPFSTEAFFAVFGQYNQALWPAVVVLWLSAVVVVVGARLKPASRATDRATGALLVVLWAWSGGIYHAWFFSPINPAAWLFGALFVGEAVVIGWAVAPGWVSSFGAAPARWRIAGLVVALYALIYPALGALFGHPYPNTPTFGVPCPTTILTVGLLLTASHVPVAVALVPLAWSVVGGSASITLGVTADYGLLACAPLLAARVLYDARASAIAWRTS